MAKEAHSPQGVVPPTLGQPSVDAERLRMHGATQALLLTGNAICGLLLVSVAWGLNPSPALAWLGALGLVLGARTWHWRAHLHARGQLDTPRWLAGYRRGFAANGAVWASASFVLFVPNDPVQQAFLVVTVAGMSAASLSLAAFDLVAVMLFVVPTGLALALRLMLHGGHSSSALALMMLLFLALVSANAIRAHREVRERLARQRVEGLQVQAVQRSEERLSEAQQLAHLGSYEWSLGSGELRWSDEHFRLWGLEPGELAPSYEVFRSGLHPADLDRVEAAIQHALAGGGGYDCTHRVVWPDGSEHYMHGRGAVSFDAAGRAVRMIGTVLDISTQREHEQALARSLENLQRTLEATGDGIFGYDGRDPSGRLLFANARFFEIWRIPAAEIASTGRAEIIAAARKLFVDPDAEVERINRILSMNQPHDDHVRLNDGRVLARRSVPMLGDHGVSRVWSFRDISTEERALEAVRTSEARLRVLLDAFPGYIHAVDENFRYTYANPRVAKLLARNSEQIVGRALAEVLGARRAAELERRLQRSLDGEQVSFEECFETADGRPTLHLNVTQVLGTDPASGTRMVYSFGNDITERRAIEEELRIASAAADAANRAKSSFLANLSHEIRTPMNGVVGMAELLLDTPLSDKQQHYARTLQVSATHLLHLLNSVLDLSKIEAGKLEIERRPFNPARLLAEIAELFAEPARAKGLDLRCEIDPKLPEWMIGDEHRVKQVLSNLVANATKFTLHGEVLLSLSCERPHLGAAHEDRECRVRFSVRDSGIGISAEAQSRLFSPFSQADSSMTRRFGGTGLGLAISRQLAERMGGSLEFTSRAGQGSTFWLSLRTETCPAPAHSPVAQCLPGEAQSYPAHVLLVEDNPVNCEIATALLESLGCTVDRAENGLAALDASQRTRYDLIFMDCQMPVMDGFEATARIRSDEREHPQRTPVPIVALTANALSGDREACLAAGMNDYLSKPIARAQLLPILERHGPRSTTRGRAAPTQPAGRGNGPVASPAFDPAVIRTLAERSGIVRPDFIERLLATFTASTPGMLARIEAAGLAGDGGEMQGATHALKSSSATVGAMALSALAQEIEARLRRGEAMEHNWPARLWSAYREFEQQLARHQSATASQHDPTAQRSDHHKL